MWRQTSLLAAKVRLALDEEPRQPGRSTGPDRRAGAGTPKAQSAPDNRGAGEARRTVGEPHPAGQQARGTAGQQYSSTAGPQYIRPTGQQASRPAVQQYSRPAGQQNSRPTEQQASRTEEPRFVSPTVPTFNSALAKMMASPAKLKEVSMTTTLERPRIQCRYKNADDESCPLDAIPNSQYCAVHDPTRQ